MQLVFAVAYAAGEGACSSCGAEFLAEIAIEDGQIRGIRYLTDQSFLPELIYEGTDRVPRYKNELMESGP